MNNAAHQDWTPVVLKKATPKPAGTGGGGGGGVKTTAGIAAHKLDDAGTEDDASLRHKSVDKNMSKAIMQARMAKKMSQKDLAAACAIDSKIVNEYETGKAIPNPSIITKLEKALGAKLRPQKAGKGGKGKGKK